jgi:arsenite methyltransferase
MTDGTVTQAVRERYGRIAREALSPGGRGGCGCGSQAATDVVTRDLYPADATAGLPREAVLASLGCGNPTALAHLAPGEVVLDLGSGGGIDVLLSARRVGPAGRAIGLDFTDEMLELARANQQRAGLDNVEFLKGSIEAIPLPDASVDVIISNCVINLSADKERALREAFRVLRPGGRFAVSDVVARRPVDPAIGRSVELWVGCVAGALAEGEYLRLLAEAGFVDASIEPTRVYEIEDPVAFARSAGVEEALVRSASGCFMGAFVRARKPAG